MTKVALRGLLTHKFRLVLTVLAVVVSVAFMSGTQVLTSTISTSFDSIFDDVYKNIDVVVRSSVEVDTGGFGKIREPIDGAVVPTVAAVDGVTAAEGQVQSTLSILDQSGDPTSSPNGGPPTFGQNWLLQPELNGWHLYDGTPPSRPDEVVLDHKTAVKAGYGPGSKVKIQLNKGVQEFTVSGTAGFGSTEDYAGSSAALFQTETAQALLVQPGKFSWINVAGAPGISQDELDQRVTAALSGQKDVQAITGKQFTAESQDVFRQFFNIIGTILLIFGLIALFVGAFIIYNTFSIIVAQRTRELALLRAMGAGRLQVLGSVALEATLVGAVASVIGLLGGVVLAWLLTKALSATGGGVNIDTLTLPPLGFLFSFLVGTFVTFVSGLFPAWRASRVPPVAAMRTVSIDRSGRSGVRLAVGAAVTVVGLALLFAGLFVDNEFSLWEVGLGVAVTLLGVIGLGPTFAKPLSAVIGAPFRSFTGRLARSNAMRNPRRTATTASALMIGVALIVLFSILTQSIKATVNSAIDTSFKADLVVNSNSFGQNGFRLDFAPQIAQQPGVASATGVQVGFATVADKPSQILGADMPAFLKVVDLSPVAGNLSGLGPDEIAVDKQTYEDNKWSIGTALPATFLKGGAAIVKVGAVYDVSGGSLGGGYLMSTAGFVAHFPPEFQIDNQIYVTVAPGTSPATVQAELKPFVKAQYPTASVQDLQEYKQSQTGFFDILLAIITVLLVLAIFIAVIGIVNTLLLSVYERTQEIGLLRAVGMGRGQVRSTIRWEAVIFSLQGTAIGIAVGFGFAAALISALSQSFAVTIAIPWGLLIAMAIIAVLAGITAAVLPSITASRLNVLDAIAAE